MRAHGAARKLKSKILTVFESNIRRPAYSVPLNMSFGFPHVCHISNEHMDFFPSACREISSLYRAIDCTSVLIPSPSRIEATLWFDGILSIATGATKERLNRHCGLFPFFAPFRGGAQLNSG